MLIDENGTSLGVHSLFTALEKSKNASLDLVEISPHNNPPVCKIMDFGRFKYEQEKKDKQNRQKSKTGDLKEIRLSAKIGEHDLQVKANKARELSSKGHKILISMRLFGRENIFIDRAKEVIRKFSAMIDMDLIEEPKKMGNQLRVNLIKKKVKEGKNAKD